MRFIEWKVGHAHALGVRRRAATALLRRAATVPGTPAAQHPNLRPTLHQVGHGGGPWHTDNPTCRGCDGLRARWLVTAAAAAGDAPPLPLSFDALLARAAFRGRILLAPDEPHALLPALTLAGLESLTLVLALALALALAP